jgi:antitoxin FitA
MAAVTIRNLSDEAHRALKIRAAKNNRSTEAEMRAILEGAALAGGRVGLGTALAEIGKKHDITNADVEALAQAIEQNRDRRTMEPIKFD